MTPDRLEILIQKLFDSRLTEDERIEFNSLLKASRSARDQYRKSMSLHAALMNKCDDGSAAGPFAQLADRPVAERRKIAPFVPRVLLAIAAMIVVFAGLNMIWSEPKAMLTGGEFEAVGGAGALTPGRIKAKTPFEIHRGSLTLTYPSGAEVTLEAPCRFQLDRKEALTVAHGRASVHAPPGAEGFELDTPGGKFIDLGTRFGVAVGSDGSKSVVLTEVFEGEINVETSESKTTRLRHGESRALLSNGNDTELVSDLDSSPIRLSRGVSSAPADRDNLALGKPVFSPGYCVRAHGSIFPPENVTDGRLNDSGVPGDWSFWLAPDGEDGEFTVDLLESQEFSKISLQNTSNRLIHDRGVENFEILVSEDNKIFSPLLEGYLPRIDYLNREDSFPFHDFTFSPVTARYVKLVVLSHYRHPTPRRNDPHSGGISEIRIFR
ncbi:discoidin domain-containing protein [Luteolibacter algae]|uniref:Discoidin domain-containing protein n=1 Tax=Luteolibacter algae TaxID=454151 RepID=A0ABW5D238_9BACT